MDPLSLTASIVGFISFAIDVTKTVTEYISDVRQAPAESRELASELSAFTNALDSLSTFLTSQDEESTSFKGTSVLYSTTRLCHGKLSAIHETLLEFSKKTEHMKWYRRLVWPFKKEHHLEVIGTLRGCMQIFHFSLSIDGW
jgi:Fungal N-terminal domain of STAND proteins